MTWNVATKLLEDYLWPLYDHYNLYFGLFIVIMVKDSLPGHISLQFIVGTLDFLRETSVLHLLSGCLCITFLSFCTWAFYRLKLHPLAPIPGPPHWILSCLPFVWALYRGRYVTRITELHGKYGPVVRTAANEVSFTNEQAWTSLYAPRKDAAKSPFWYAPRQNNGSYGIFTAPSGITHGRFRRAFSPAFTQKSMRELEPMILQHIDILISQLKKEASKDTPLDVVPWFEYMAFDIVGELIFSKSFHSLTSNENHHLVVTLRKYSDLMTYFSLARADGRGLTVTETENAIGDIMIAGSETVATTLTSILYHLVRNADAHKVLTSEVRGAFKNGNDITIQAVTNMEFLNAVINEAMRLCPSLPMVLPRMVNEPGIEVCGYWLPAGTLVNSAQLPAYISPTNFARPNNFIPERWLPASTLTPHNTTIFNPFSIGPRDCVGRAFGLAEVRLALAKLTFHFEFEKGGKEDYNWNDQKAFFVLEKEPFFVRLVGRN
ncbi:hypothetical protein OCU04_003722 [Sclerotinia nivalis]|uniref:Cytochrome P450 n=1 Tax=Sclerotinia nivalis TaxID=352851 RepID=A0A9X0ASH3_9HELO|nr:hypothetical protein OCU04_003722 [Sclerotinia nivalis]